MRATIQTTAGRFVPESQGKVADAETGVPENRSTEKRSGRNERQIGSTSSEADI